MRGHVFDANRAAIEDELETRHDHRSTIVV
jgi:hypothetical protein